MMMLSATEKSSPKSLELSLVISAALFWLGMKSSRAISSFSELIGIS